MKRFLLVCLLLIWISSTIYAEPTVAEQCQNNTVVITDHQGHGSGVLFTRTNVVGDQVTFIWTVGHAADRVMKSDGTFDELTIIRGGRHTQAIVLRASDYEINHDVALLQIVDSNDFYGDAEFYQASNHVKVGQPIIHVGTPEGPIHECSVFCGNVSFVDRKYNIQPVLKPRLVDQINVTNGFGCSGGGIFDAETGRILGLTTLRTTDTIMFITPTRYIYEWAKLNDCLWAFDREVPLPVEIIPWLSNRHKRLIAEQDTLEIDSEPEPIQL